VRLRVTFGVTRITIVDLLCLLRLRCGFLSLAGVPGLCSSSITNSTGSLLLLGSGHIAMTTFLTQLLLAQISPKLFVSKTAAQTGSSNCKRAAILIGPWPGAMCQDICLADIVSRDHSS